MTTDLIRQLATVASYQQQRTWDTSHSEPDRARAGGEGRGEQRATRCTAKHMHSCDDTDLPMRWVYSHTGASIVLFTNEGGAVAASFQLSYSVDAELYRCGL